MASAAGDRRPCRRDCDRLGRLRRLGGELRQSVFKGSPSTQEGIHVATNGTVLITTRSIQNYNEIEYRTLAGEAVELASEDSLERAYLTPERRPPGLFEKPVLWSARLEGLYSFTKPGAAWYLIRSATRPGYAYFEVFDKASKQPIGYFSRNGFHNNRPSEADQFDVGEWAFGRSGNQVVTHSSNMYRRQYVNRHWYEETSAGTIPYQLLFLKDGDRVLEINMRTQTGRTLIDLSGEEVLSLDMLREPLPLTSAAAKDEAKDVAPIDRKRKTQQFVVVRTEAGEIHRIDPLTDSTRRFAIPVKLLHNQFIVRSLGDDRLLIQVDGENWGGGPRVDLYWTNIEGTIERQEHLKLAGNAPEDLKQTFWLVSTTAPVPVAWLVGWSTVSPLVMLQDHVVDEYADAFAKGTEQMGNPLVAVCVLGLLMGLVTWRWHRQTYRPHTLLWATTVTLLGPAGLLAYWIHWGKPATTQCTTCERRVPRNHETCPACAADWANPPTNGLEVFA